MVDIEIGDGDPLQSVLRQRVDGGDGNIVVQAEAHGPIRLGVVARRTHVAEDRIGLSRHHQVHPVGGGSGGMPGGLQSVATQVDIGVEGQNLILSQGSGRLLQIVQVFRVMDPQQLLPGDRRRLLVQQQPVQAAGQEAIVDGIQTFRAFRVAVWHPVPMAAWVGEDGRQHGLPPGWAPMRCRNDDRRPRERS